MDARWDKIVDYFELLENESDRIQVTDLGSSTEGHPYLLVIIARRSQSARLGHCIYALFFPW